MPVNPAAELLRSLLSDDRHEADIARGTSITMNIQRLQIGPIHIIESFNSANAERPRTEASNADQSHSEATARVPEPNGARARSDAAVQFFRLNQKRRRRRATH